MRVLPQRGGAEVPQNTFTDHIGNTLVTIAKVAAMFLAASFIGPFFQRNPAESLFGKLINIGQAFTEMNRATERISDCADDVISSTGSLFKEKRSSSSLSGRAAPAPSAPPLD